MTKSLPRLRYLSLALMLIALPLSAIAQGSTEKPANDTNAARYERFRTESVLHSYTLQHALGQNEENEVLIAVRNMVDPSTKIYLVASQNVIEIFAPADQQQLAQQIIRELDRPKQSFKLTYTLTQVDGGKRVGTQHYTMIVVPGQRTVFKTGSKVPVLVAGAPGTGQGEGSQYQYLDVGMNFDTTIDPYGNGLRLRSKIEQSSIADEKSSVGLQDPIVRQTVLEGSTLLATGKPTILGSVDVPDSTRRVDVEVVAEPIP